MHEQLDKIAHKGGLTAYQTETALLAGVTLNVADRIRFQFMAHPDLYQRLRDLKESTVLGPVEKVLVERVANVIAAAENLADVLDMDEQIYEVARGL